MHDKKILHNIDLHIAWLRKLNASTALIIRQLMTLTISKQSTVCDHVFKIWNESPVLHPTITTSHRASHLLLSGKAFLCLVLMLYFSNKCNWRSWGTRKIVSVNICLSRAYCHRFSKVVDTLCESSAPEFDSGHCSWQFQWMCVCQYWFNVVKFRRGIFASKRNTNREEYLLRLRNIDWIDLKKREKAKTHIGPSTQTTL